jgi:hypothetical protein
LVERVISEAVENLSNSVLEKFSLSIAGGEGRAQSGGDPAEIKPTITEAIALKSPQHDQPDAPHEAGPQAAQVHINAFVFGGDIGDRIAFKHVGWQRAVGQDNF